MERLGLRVVAEDRPGLLRDLSACVADWGGNIEGVHILAGAEAEVIFEARFEKTASALPNDLAGLAGVRSVEIVESLGAVFGKRVIVMGGGAQVAQVVLGAVTEADRHNIRGERISVDTIPLVGEAKLAEAVRAVARLPRAKILVLAGSLMGGDVAAAVRELRAQGIPVISLAMIGSVPDSADLVVSDPVQAGTMAVMAIADTASFDLNRARGRRL